jgi:uncharacterized alpha-E superfamily protein
MPWIDPAAATPQQIIALVHRALFEPSQPARIRALLNKLVEATGNVRDRLPADCWHALTALGRAPLVSVSRATPVQVLLRLNDLVTLGTSLAGAIDESMPRDDSWHFLEIGKRLERAIQLVTLMRGISGVRFSSDGAITHVSERRQLQAILALVGANIAPTVTRVLDRRAVLEAVLANGDDPRTLIYQLISLNTHLALLPQSVRRDGAAASLVTRAAERVAAALVMVREAIAVATRGEKKPSAVPEPENNSLRAAFSLLDTMLPEISDLLSRAYFTHAFARRA